MSEKVAQNPVERFTKAVAAVDEGALKKALNALSELCDAQGVLAAACRVGHAPNVGHNSAFERSRVALHESHAGAVQALDKFEAFKSLHVKAREFYLAAEKAKESQS